MQLTYYKEKTAAELPETIFEQDFNEDLVHQLVNTVISNNHSGTNAQKNRSDVRGGGKNLGDKKDPAEQELEQLVDRFGDQVVLHLLLDPNL